MVDPREQENEDPRCVPGSEKVGSMASEGFAALVSKKKNKMRADPECLT